jgi:hypothetical protein
MALRRLMKEFYDTVVEPRAYASPSDEFNFSIASERMPPGGFRVGLVENDSLQHWKFAFKVPGTAVWVVYFSLHSLPQLTQSWLSLLCFRLRFQKISSFTSNLVPFAWCQGPADTPYAEGAFVLEFKFLNEYPFRPPAHQLETVVPHPNVRPFFFFSKSRICSFVSSAPVV